MMSPSQEGLPPLQTMDEMQCMWFQQGLGAAYERLGMFGDALQKFHEIDRVGVVCCVFVFVFS